MKIRVDVDIVRTRAEIRALRAELERAQDNCCAICGRHALSSRYGTLCLDHDHRNGAPRGLLCQRCNTALGLLDDDIGRLAAATEYLKAHQPLYLAIQPETETP